MLTRGMNIEQQINEVKQDYGFVFKLALASVQKMVNRYAPLTNRMISHAYHCHSKNRNHWLYSIHVSARERFVQLYTCFYDKSGFTALYRQHQSPFTLLFNQHFFERYNQRMNLKIHKHEDRLCAYMLANSHYAFYDRRRVNEHVVKFVCLTETGIIMGRRDDRLRVYYMGTFIPYEILGQRQFGMVSHIYKKVMELYNQQYINPFKKVA